MTYHTLLAESTGVYREKMSRFLSFAIPVRNEDEAKECVRRYQNKYHDARHVCWAYMLGADMSLSYSNDNGEPSGTAGRPILGQIKSAGITNVIVVVVRYFGGIKLGTSGLIAAYREAARLAIDNGEIVERQEMAQITFEFPYLSMNMVMKILKQTDVKIVGQQFDNLCKITIDCSLEQVDTLTTRLADADARPIQHDNES